MRAGGAHGNKDAIINREITRRTAAPKNLTDFRAERVMSGP